MFFELVHAVMSVPPYFLTHFAGFNFLNQLFQSFVRCSLAALKALPHGLCPFSHGDEERVVTLIIGDLFNALDEIDHLRSASGSLGVDEVDSVRVYPDHTLHLHRHHLQRRYC